MPKSKMMRKTLLGLSASVFMLACAPLSHAEPSDYVIDDAHTHIVWKVKRFGFTDTVGTFATINGLITLDKDAPENSQVTASVALSGLRSDLEEREDIIRGPYWLDAESHPTINFQSNSVELIDGENCELGCAKVHGNMMLKGVEMPVTLIVNLNKMGTDPVTRNEAVGFSAEGQFNRSEFNIATALGPIGDLVTFEMEVLAVAKPEEEN